jgi:hypothetical protein
MVGLRERNRNVCPVTDSAFETFQWLVVSREHHRIHDSAFITGRTQLRLFLVSNLN